METVSIDGIPMTAEEIARPAGWHCRLLETADTKEYILGYLTSVGPYKIDVERFHRLTAAEAASYRSGQLQLASLAQALAGES